VETVVAAPKALVGRAITGPAYVRVHNGQIVEVGSGTEGTAEVFQSGLLTPGLVDIQVNGAFGIDFAEADEQGLRMVATSLPSTGVTSFLPTLITAPVPVILEQAHNLIAAERALEGIAAARPLGVHLEGPFLSPVRHGVHEPDLMALPTPELVDLILRDSTVMSALRMLTLAPELSGALDFIRRLVDAGVLVSVGHTDATAAQVKAAGDAGARMVTHLFNAQRPLGHREPGVPGAALVDPRFTLGLIADLAHVAGDICKLVFQLASDRVALVTDAVAAAGMPPGRYQLGGEDVLLTDEGVPRSPTGTIAGSALTLDRAVRNMISIGIDPAVALCAATVIPADVIGEPTLGRLTPGARADLIWWDDDMRPRKVWVGGEVVFDAADPAQVGARDAAMAYRAG
jgi:N-acetylglucosamine-6-phosphate deacetylase